MTGPPTGETQRQGIARHMHLLLAAGIPLILAQIAQMAINVTDTVMMGWLGATELAAGTLAFQFFFFLWIFGSGFAFALVPMAASAHGKGDAVAARRQIRMGLWVVTACFAVFLIPMSWCAEILVAMGQEPALAALAQSYMDIAKWSMLPMLLVSVLRSLAVALERTRIVLFVTLFSAVLNAILNYAFIFGNFGAPRMEMPGAGLATLLTGIATFAFVALWIAVRPEYRQYAVFQRLWRSDFEVIGEIIRLGWPVSLTIMAEVSLFAFASIMMGWLGEIQLAAHGIALQIASIAFMVPLGLSNAATARIGIALGRRDAQGLMHSGQAAIIATVIFAMIAAVLMVAIPQTLIGFWLADGDPLAGAVASAAVPLLWVAAAFQLVDGLQVTGVGLLRGLKDTRIPMFIAMFSYWMVGVPIALLAGFVWDLGGIGVWAGLAGGLTVAAVLLPRRYFRQAGAAVSA